MITSSHSIRKWRIMIETAHEPISTVTQAVTCDHNRFVIDGKPRVLLCASLFPFRVPRGQWQQRLEAVKRLGYHAIDVYIPWNFHETAPGVWDFSGRHDIEEFLRLTHETGLYAMVRPGPYICSEWDGGAIPAWVATNPARGGGDALRQNDPRFLNAVREWYDHILPIIVRQQYGHGGPVIAVQADNELDFYACRDPRGYIGALADMMRAAGVDVPIVACAGQGDIERAFGDAAGVTPAVNLYADDNGVDMDAHIRYYRAACDRYDAPLIVTETNRWHRTLRRMVGNGARFVGPFLQVSGWDFDFTTSVNNWGRLESYMTHDYDFGGVIDPAGQERPDADDARRLSAIIGALGERLASAEPAREQTVAVRRGDDRGDGWLDGNLCADGPTPLDAADAGLGVAVLDLAGGGQLLTLTNVSRHELAVAPRGDTTPDVTLPSGAGVMIVRDLPIDDRLTLMATSAELVGLDDGRMSLAAPITRTGDMWAEFVGRNGSAITVINQTGDVRTDAGDGSMRVSGTDGTVTFAVGDGRRAYRVTLSQPVARYAPHSAPAAALAQVDTAEAHPAWTPVDVRDGHAIAMEDAAVYAGAMRYRAQLDPAIYGNVTGIVLYGASDTISVRYGDAMTPWRANGGGALYIPFADGHDSGVHAADVPTTSSPSHALTVTARIWGHSNFDDNRLPSLRLDAKRGIRGALAVTCSHDLGSGWLTAYDPENAAEERRLRDAGLVLGDHPKPRGGLGGRTTSVWPNALAYTRVLHVGDTAAALHVSNGQARLDVWINGEPLAALTPLQPTVRIAGGVHDGDRLTVVVHRTWGEDAGRMTLLTGREVCGWSMETQGLAELHAAADRAFGESADSPSRRHATTAFPLEVAPGEGVWLRIASKVLADAICSMNTVVRFDGDGLQLTAFTDALCLGRVVLGGIPGTVFAGGRGDLFLVPQGEGDLRLYVESTGDVPGRLTGITIGGPVDLPRGR